MSPNDDLKQTLKRIHDVFDVEAIIAQDLSLSDVAMYYEQSYLGYQIFHSLGGSVHMSLSEDGQSLHHDYTVQVAAVADRLTPSIHRILELGSGKGFNLRHLAEDYPQICFHGIDLTPVHTRYAHRKLQSMPNARVMRADFHHLPFADQTFDLVYEIESVCHALDMKRALSDAYRVLRNDGQFVVFDGFRVVPSDEMTDDQLLARYLIEKTLFVDEGILVSEFLELAQEVGFRQVEVLDISQQIMPNLRHFQRIVNIFLPTTFQMRIAKAILPPYFARNMISAMLMPHLVGVTQGYFKIILQR